MPAPAIVPILWKRSTLRHVPAGPRDAAARANSERRRWMPEWLFRTTLGSVTQCGPGARSA